MADWNPDLYLRFREERTQPARDLLARVPTVHPQRVLDAGCGPGNSTAELVRKWPNAEVTGLDASPAMLAQAAKQVPDAHWVEADLRNSLTHLGMFDVVFSNAVLQWLPDQAAVIHHLASLVRPGGTLAVQVPNMHGMPLRKVISEVAALPAWQMHFADMSASGNVAGSASGNVAGSASDITVENADDGSDIGEDGGLLYREPEWFYDILCGLSPAGGWKVAVWETMYFHVMPNVAAISEWYRATGMKPWLDMLETERLREQFEADVTVRLAGPYPLRPDGQVLFPFRRVFFTATRT